jgi:general secretion pathway protein A
MSYEEFFHLKEQPFSNTPDSRFYFESQEHQRAMLRLLHAANTMKGLALLVGDVGTGKTTLARKLLDNLDEREYESVLIVVVHSAVTPEWLLRKIALQMGVKELPEGKIELLSALFKRLMEINEAGRKAVVLVDEAQMLQTRELMEEFRGLLNLEMPGRKLITFIFFALPNIDQNLSLDEPLKQRVAVRFKLESMKPAATAAYIDHRLKVAGSDAELFPKESVELIHQYSRGIPRLINIICDNALFESFLMKEHRIKPELIDTIAEDLGLKKVYHESDQRGTSDRRAATLDRRSAARPAADDRPNQRLQLSKEEMEALDFLQEMDQK